MITPEWLSYKLDEIKVMRELEDSVIEDMARRIIKMGRASDTTAWQAEMLQQSGMLYNDIVSRVAEKSKLLESEIKGFYTDAKTEIFNYDPVLLREAGIDAEGFRTFSPAMTAIWKAAVIKTCTEAKNLTKTLANTSQASFISACDLASMQVSSGAFSYTQAIVNAVKKVADTGGIIQYPSGRCDRLDVAVRRAVLTGVNQTSGRVMLMQAQDKGFDLMEISAHAGARPEHAVWQGHIVSLSGDTDGNYLTLDDIGYGDVTGFQGANCRHTWSIFFDGVSEPLYSAEQLRELAEETVTYNGEEIPRYEANQRQRHIERKIREVRRELVGIDAGIKNAVDDETKQNLQTEFASQSLKLKITEKKLRIFCDETGIKLDNSRLQVYNVIKDSKSLGGFNKSISQKAVREFEKKKLPNYKNMIIEDNKLKGYALNPQHLKGKYKAIAFQNYLGYNIDNRDDLVKKVREEIASTPAKIKGRTEYGQKYEVKINIKGANNKRADVLTAWIFEFGSDKPRLTSIYVKE